MILVTVAAALAGLCADADPTPRLDAAEAAFGRDLPGFVAATEALIAEAPCWPVPIAPATAARVHRVVGLRSFVDKDLEHARSAFAAARAADPTYQFPPELLPEGHRARALYDGATAEPRSAWVAGVGQHWFDGVEGTQRPVSRATIAQWRDGDATLSAYLWPTDPMFGYLVRPSVTPDPPDPPQVEAPIVPPPVIPPVKPPPPPTSRRRWIAPAATLGGAAVVYGVALGVATDYRRGDHDDAELGRLRSTANGLVIASGVLAVAGVGLGVAVAF